MTRKTMTIKAKKKQEDGKWGHQTRRKIQQMWEGPYTPSTSR